jgi:hypothetical protein
MRNGMATLAEGALGGVAATWLLRQGLKRSNKLPEALQPPAPRREPGDFVVSQAERLVGKLPERVRGRVAGGLSWAYGVSGPVALALLARPLKLERPRRALVAGALMGAAVFAAGYLGWMRAAGLIAPLKRHGLTRHAATLGNHVAYGMAAALPIALIESRRARRRRRFFDRLFPRR